MMKNALTKFIKRFTFAIIVMNSAAVMKQFPFIGRQNELKNLNDLLQKKTSSLVVIKGRRRIGKSRLVEEFAKGHRFLSFSGLVPTGLTTDQLQREAFARQLKQVLNLPILPLGDWSNLFSFLARETREGRVIILLDEISWMGSKDPDFLGKLKNAWDMEFKKNPELILILCGSVSTWIDENILRHTGFMGRLSLRLDLKELTLPECHQLLNAIRFPESSFERFKILSVTGGIPRYLEEIKPDRLGDENIKDLCFKRSGILFNEFNDIFLDIFARRSELYKKMVETLVDGSKELSEITDEAGVELGGHISNYLSDLVKSGFISRDYTWAIKNAKPSKLSHYRLSDNYLRFYLKYIEKNNHKVERDFFEDQPLSILPGLDSIMGLQFENLVLNNRKFIWKKLNIYADNIITDNPYFQKAGSRKKGCQIDYLIQTRADILYVCEIKFSKQPVDTSVIETMKSKITNLYRPKGYAVQKVLIHVSGVTDKLIDEQYFNHMIDFKELLQSQ